MPDLLGPLVSAGGVLLALNLKSLPLAYHARFIAETAKTYMENRKKPANIDQLFAVHSTSFRVFFDDLDYNLHMNNSCYHKYADYGRVSYATVTKMERCLTDGVNFICAGSIARHERALSPLQRFTLSTRLVEYDDKCIRLLQVFHPGKSHYVPCSSDRPFAILLSKFVFRKDKSTMRPRTCPPSSCPSFLRCFLSSFSFLLTLLR
mmetsp:Transcript_18414/g.46250  ORF Transcript_18414/g.46250 Transcript_18414/m.46250 type:complete len:206 (-) Transcript_18414:1230-1847(-)